MTVAHPPHTRDERRESPDDGHEAGDDDRLPAVLVIEGMRLFQIALLENLRVRITEKSGSEQSPDLIVGCMHAAATGERPSGTTGCGADACALDRTGRTGSDLCEH